LLRNISRSGENQILLFIDELKSPGDMQETPSPKSKVYDILIQSNPEPVFIYEKENLRFIEVNQAALNLYGFTKSEFLQMDLTDLYAPEDIQTLLSALNVTIKEGEFSGPFRQKKKDGSFIYVEVSKFQLRYSNKDAHFNVIRDLTRKLEIEKESQLFKAAFDNTEQLVFVTDSSGFIRFVNNAVISTLGYSKAELERTAFAALVQDQERANINTGLFKALKHGSKKILIDLKNSKGEFLSVDLTASPLLDYKNEVDAFTLLGNIKRKEEVREVTKEIVVERIVPADGNGNGENIVLLSSIFHEILTPINVILGFVQEITDGLDVMTPEQKEAAEIINQNRVSLLSTMNSIVEYYNLEKKTPDMSLLQISAREIYDNLQNDFAELNRSRGIQIITGKIHPSLYFETDKSKFTNLLFLLAKIAGYLSKDKKVFMSISSLDRNRFAVTFKNNSERSSSSFLESVLKVFSPGGMNSNETGVPKLSLKLANRLLTLFNGELFVKEDNSELGFAFPLTQKNVEVKRLSFADENINVKRPSVEIPRSPKTFQRETTLNLSSLNCLYIEDQVDSQILFKVQMKDLGNIQFAVSFEEALPLLDKTRFDFIVMDINLQGEYNGLDALRIIQRMPEYKNIPVIAVTAYLLPGDREKFISAGFNDFVPKPIFREKMIDAIEKVLKRK
jgi:PAS domain S-box-containing protein